MTPAVRSLYPVLALLATFAILFAPAPIEGPIAERARPLEAVDGRILAPTVREGRVALTPPVVRTARDQRALTAVAAAGLAALLLFAMRPAWLGRPPSATPPRMEPPRTRIARGPPAPRVA